MPCKVPAESHLREQRPRTASAQQHEAWDRSRASAPRHPPTHRGAAGCQHGGPPHAQPKAQGPACCWLACARDAWRRQHAQTCTVQVHLTMPPQHADRQRVVHENVCTLDDFYISFHCKIMVVLAMDDDAMNDDDDEKRALHQQCMEADAKCISLAFDCMRGPGRAAARGPGRRCPTKLPPAAGVCAPAGGAFRTATRAPRGRGGHAPGSAERRGGPRCARRAPWGARSPGRAAGAGAPGPEVPWAQRVRAARQALHRPGAVARGRGCAPPWRARARQVGRRRGDPAGGQVFVAAPHSCTRTLPAAGRQAQRTRAAAQRPAEGWPIQVGRDSIREGVPRGGPDGSPNSS